MKMRIWNDNPGYLVVSEPKTEYLVALLSECKGGRKISSFSMDCSKKSGFNASIFEKLFAKKGAYRTGPYPYGLLCAAIECAEPESNVSLDQLLFANGVLPMKRVTDVIDTLKPVKREVKDFRRKRYIAPNKEVFTHTEDAFFQNVSSYAEDCNKEKQKTLQGKIKEISKSGFVWDMLQKRRNIKEEEKNQKLSDNIKFLSTGKDPKSKTNLSEEDSFKQSLNDVLDDVFFSDEV